MWSSREKKAQRPQQQSATASVRITQTAKIPRVIALKGAEQLIATISRKREEKRTRQKPASSSKSKQCKEEEAEEEETEPTANKQNAVSVETREQIRLKYDQMGIDDPEEWNWPDGPQNKTVSTMKTQYGAESNPKPRGQANTTQ